MGYVSGYSTPRGHEAATGATATAGSSIRPMAAAVPGRDGGEPVLEPPVSSIRWEMLREGIEDYEYLYLLRELLAERARPDGSPQTKSGTDRSSCSTCRRRSPAT